MKSEYNVQLVNKRVLGDTCAVLTFSCPEIAAEGRPGQFINLSCSKFLKRPFGIMCTDKVSGTFSIGVRKVGKGTEQILTANEGDQFTVLGPLGNGFDFDGVGKLILVGGGTGIFPIFFAAEYASELGIPVTVVNGYRSKADAFLYEDFSKITENFMVTTDSGDLGIKGNVMACLSELDKAITDGATCFVVGPGIMMQKVSEWAMANGLSCYVSLEQRMACGIGACLVCVCKIKAEQEGKEFVHKRCCKDGPVFRAEEVIW
ncbi:MAG: dihydroorotate dehydrogenase electron transfer subunit [Clostridiales bacterium]|nr:dihydroorotate dehydrogenase electron transfer subunit [Clostridiales bacterium]